MKTGGILGFRMDTGCLGEHREGLLLSFWIPEDSEKLQPLLLESPGPKRSPTGSAPPTCVRMGLSPSCSVAWQPRKVIFGQSCLSFPKRSSWSMGCLLGFPEPHLLLAFGQCPHILWGTPLVSNLEKTPQGAG